MDRTERDRFGPTRCGPVDDVIKWSEERDYILLPINPNFFCTNDAPFATENKHTANDVMFKDVTDFLCYERP